MENNIPTAEEFLIGKPFTIPSLYNCMIEFAKLHVEAALKEAANNAEAIPYSEGAVGQCGVDTDSIILSYSLTNIK